MANRSLFQEAEEPNDSASDLRKLSEFESGEAGDCFALLSKKEQAETRDGKPYYRCQFRDVKRTVTAMIWSDSTWFELCNSSWETGEYFKIRCRYSENQYGPQIDIERIRSITPEDSEEGFSPADFLPRSRFDAGEMFDELCQIVTEKIHEKPLQQLVLKILIDNAEQIREYPAASRNHHAYRSGYLEHVLSVTKTALHLAEKYDVYYPTISPPCLWI